MGHAWILGSMPIPLGAHLPLARAAPSPLLPFAPHPAALLWPPLVTRPAQVTSGDGRELAAVSGHSYSCHLRDPIPCPEMLFIPRGGGTNAPKFGDFSALVAMDAIGTIRTLIPGQKSTRDAPWHLLWLLCPHLVPTNPYSGRECCCLQALGQPWEQAEHPHSGAVKGLGHGRGLTTISCPFTCPLPTAALRKPDQHGSAGELRQRRPGHAAEGAWQCPAPAQG